jgi:hypothetical protein
MQLQKPGAGNFFAFNQGLAILENKTMTTLRESL